MWVSRVVRTLRRFKLKNAAFLYIDIIIIFQIDWTIGNKINIHLKSNTTIELCKRDNDI